MLCVIIFHLDVLKWIVWLVSAPVKFISCWQLKACLTTRDWSGIQLSSASSSSVSLIACQIQLDSRHLVFYAMFGLVKARGAVVITGAEGGCGNVSHSCLQAKSFIPRETQNIQHMTASCEDNLFSAFIPLIVSPATLFKYYKNVVLFNSKWVEPQNRFSFCNMDIYHFLIIVSAWRNG